MMTTNNISRWYRAVPYLCLGLACLTASRPAPAQQAATISHNISPMTPERQAQFARIQSLDHTAAVALHAGDYATAEADAREALSWGLDSGVASEILAGALDAQGKEQDAFLVYKGMVDAKDDAPRVLLPYALLSLKDGQWPQALAAYQKAQSKMGELNGPVMPHLDLTFHPDTPQPTLLAAAIHVALGLTDNGGCDWANKSQDDKALAEYQQALQLEPNWSLAHFYYAYGLQRLGRKAEARAAFAQAAAMGDDAVRKAVQQLSQ